MVTRSGLQDTDGGSHKALIAIGHTFWYLMARMCVGHINGNSGYKATAVLVQGAVFPHWVCKADHLPADFRIKRRSLQLEAFPIHLPLLSYRWCLESLVPIRSMRVLEEHLGVTLTDERV